MNFVGDVDMVRNARLPLPLPFASFGLPGCFFFVNLGTVQTVRLGTLVCRLEGRIDYAPTTLTGLALYYSNAAVAAADTVQVGRRKSEE